MPPVPKHKYWSVLLITALVINEHVVQWALAVHVGGYSVGAGFADAFAHFNMLGYVFFTTFRLVPYVLLGLLLAFLERTRFSDYSAPVLVGGFIGIVAMILVVTWGAQAPYYTDVRVSSTTALAFLFVPVYAVPAGLFGAALAAALYTPFRARLNNEAT